MIVLVVCFIVAFVSLPVVFCCFYTVLVGVLWFGDLLRCLFAVLTVLIALFLLGDCICGCCLAVGA